MGQAPILDLNALEPDRPPIRIRTEANKEGDLYELRVREELSIEQLTKLGNLGEKAAQLGEPEQLTHEEVGLLEVWMDEMLDIAFHHKPPDEVYDLINLSQKADIAAAFSRVCLGATDQPEQTPKPKSRKRSTGASSSGGSKRSTAATRKRG